MAANSVCRYTFSPPVPLLSNSSILMAVRVEDIKAAYEKLETYRKGKSVSDEETDEDEAD